MRAFHLYGPAQAGLAIQQWGTEIISDLPILSRTSRLPIYMASMEARVVRRSFLLPNLDICRKASTP